MDSFANQPAEIRAELFTETAAKMGVSPQIIEKDFWVCWTLRRVFRLETPIASLIFKGGTSLSKSYGLIERFSEDIDLSLDRHDLGFTGERDPANPEISGGKRKNLLKELSQRAAQLVQGELKEQIQAAMGAALSNIDIDLSLTDEDKQTLIFTYPASLGPSVAAPYVRPVVRLEFGARSDHLPAETSTVTPYAAEQFPKQFSDAASQVKTLSPERTFWEKATILHMLYHQDDEKALGERMSRHYYDLAQLAQSDVKTKALENLDLLSEVALHKIRFFPAAWANYEDAKPATLKLMPHETLKQKLRADYRAMNEMIFGVAPSFKDLMNVIEGLEREINELG